MTRQEITPAKAKSERRTAAQIAQDDLNNTLEKLGKARARRGRLEQELEKAKASITSLTALADYQSSHPALQQQDEVDEQVTQPAGVTPVADA